MKHFRLVIVLATGLLSFLAMGCASIMSGTSQQVTITSEPPGAKVTIDPGDFQGTTPFPVTLPKGKDYTVTAEKPGYNKATQTIGTSLNAWVFGNILFGGIIGIIVDVVDGASMNLDKDRVHFDLTSNKPQP